MIRLCLALLCLAPAALADQTNTVRLLAVYSNCFDYVFSSIVTAAGDRPTVSFNHLSGRTFFVRVGERLDDYIVESVAPRTEEVFNPAINASLPLKTGSVTLRKDAEKVILEMNKPLRQLGYLALLGWLDTGVTAYARVGTTIGTAPERVVVAIEPSQVATTSPEGALNIASATQSEREGLVTLWRQRLQEETNARVADAQRQDAVAVAAPVVPQAGLAAAGWRGPRRLVELTFDPLQIVNVTPTRMPVGWAVVPVTRTVNGKQVTSYETKEFTVPMPQFDRIEYRGSIMTYAP
jgi:hypothetical protein